jgi:hypothetical protein
MTRALERALARLFQKRLPVQEPIKNLSPAAFRAVIDERLRNLEHQLDEVKGRVNGLLFLLAGAVATQVVIRLFV